MDQIDPGQETLDGKPYATLVYADGFGPNRSVDLSNVDTSELIDLLLVAPLLVPTVGYC